MVDRELLRKKKLFQQTKNEISQIEGIRVLEYEPDKILDEDTLQKIGFYGAKKPDAEIDYNNDTATVVEWIAGILDFEADTICYLWHNTYLVKIQISDVRKAIETLWLKLNPRSKGFILLNKFLNEMYEFGSDSRDEDNILYDRYLLTP